MAAMHTRTTAEALANTWSGPSQQRKIISVYAEKGGVGKTTTSATLAFEYAALGHRVLIYDCDPQRSLSAWLLHRKFNEEHDNPFEYYMNVSPENKLGDPHGPANLVDQITPIANQGINTAPLPAKVVYLAGKVRERDVEPVNRADNNWDPRGRVFLVPGHRRLNRYDSDFATANALLPMMNSQVMTLAMPYHCILRTGNEYEADTIILDLNPSSGWLNTALLMSSHYILVPTVADFFSNEMARNLSQAMLEMRDNCQRFTAVYDRLYPGPNHLAGTLRYRFPSHRTKIIGYVLTRFSLAVGQPTYPVQADGLIGDDLLAAEQRWFERLRASFDQLHHFLLPHGLVVNSAIYERLRRGLCLGKVRDYFALGDRSHEYSLPVIALSLSPEFNMLHATRDQRERIAAFQEIFCSTVRTVEALIAADREMDPTNDSFPSLA